MIIFDNHFHLDPSGDGALAVKKFFHAGGTHLMCVNKPYNFCRFNYQEEFNTTIRMAKTSGGGTGVKIYSALGPHPIDLVHLWDTIGPEKAIETVKSGIDLACSLILQGKAQAMGEIGRPHFPVDKNIWDASNNLLKYAMGLAADNNFPVILHTESADESVFMELSFMADSAGLSREKVIKHYSSPLISSEENHGIFPSILAGNHSIETLIEKLALKNNPKRLDFMLETDYIDDPKRPGAVLGPAVVPRKFKNLVDSGVLSEDDVYRINVTNPQKLYDIVIE